MRISRRRSFIVVFAVPIRTPRETFSEMSTAESIQRRGQPLGASHPDWGSWLNLRDFLPQCTGFSASPPRQRIPTRFGGQAIGLTRARRQHSQSATASKPAHLVLADSGCASRDPSIPGGARVSVSKRFGERFVTESDQIAKPLCDGGRAVRYRRRRQSHHKLAVG